MYIHNARCLVHIELFCIMMDNIIQQQYVKQMKPKVKINGGWWEKWVSENKEKMIKSLGEPWSWTGSRSAELASMSRQTPPSSV